MRPDSIVVLVLAIVPFLVPATSMRAHAESATTARAQDASIYEDQKNTNGGLAHEICLGNYGEVDKTRRAYVRHDLPNIPAGAVITRVEFPMVQNRAINLGQGPQAATLELYRATSAWVEGNGNAEVVDGVCGGGGVPDGAGVTWNNAPSNLNASSLTIRLGSSSNLRFDIDTDDGDEYDRLLDDVQAWVDGEEYHGWFARISEENTPGNARGFRFGALTIHWTEDTEPEFAINAGLNDAWYNPLTDGQGIFVIVYPDIKLIFLAWFTYETGAPPSKQSAAGLNAVLGDDEHRWLTASGFYEPGSDRVLLDISITRGGKFDAGDPVERETDGTLELIFEDCKTGVVKYTIPSIDRSGEVPIQRVANDNVALCEALNSD